MDGWMDGWMDEWRIKEGKFIWLLRWFWFRDGVKSAADP
jgi:hypothetical protein